MVRRALGQTGYSLTPIGFGAFKIGRNQGIKYAHGYALPDEREVATLLNGVLDLGINYIDTAPAYGLSEERIGAAIAHRKKEFVLSTKVGEVFSNGRGVFDFSAKAVRESIAKSCNRLRVEAIDVCFVHSDGDDLRIINETDVIATLQDLKHAGDVREIGFSGKTVEGAAELIRRRLVDVLMVEYHADDRTHENVIADAAGAGIGVVAKKPLASGTLAPSVAIPFVLANRDVTSMVIGGLNLDHIRDNLRIVDEMEPRMNTDEHGWE